MDNSQNDIRPPEPCTSPEYYSNPTPPWHVAADVDEGQGLTIYVGGRENGYRIVLYEDDLTHLLNPNPNLYYK